MMEVNGSRLEEWLGRAGFWPRVKIEGKLIVDIEPTITTFKVEYSLTFKGDAMIRDGCRIEGSDLTFGPNSYMDHNAEIGGGSCMEGIFRCGKNFHLGSYAMVNTARDVIIGDNVGIGRMSLVATHGAYLDVTQGFPERWGPVTIDDNVWLPYAIVMPNVRIGSNTVVAAGSLVNRDIEGGGLWAGWPAKRIEGVKYPNPWSEEQANVYKRNLGNDKNHLRRHGIRNL